MSTRVLLVDDHPVVRAGLRALLEGMPEITVVAEAQDAVGAQQRARPDDIDVVVMDIQMGSGPTGIDATRAIRAADGPPVLILTTYDTQSDILSALEAGATGYLLKDAPEEALREAILDAAANRSVLSPQVTAQLVMRTTQPASALSPREIEILKLAATGASNRNMAKQLFISEATVKTHLVHVYNKLGVDNRTAAINRARQQRII
ncbi:response regulator transcription factor [Kocuria sp. cx-455]|uniref:response regulator n=1 Tax=unclassified Candidatus Sulfotelmatobacter TaxID=2635724 RepID=UPI001683D53E|nr:MULTISPECIES: response regulator transcription factor [unclassified Candidatus Sulfotelmatobacter]MBD2763481.1 response regulator transcription factor [Kocuria sp. cx-116]MBD2766170.1 response regulator transcription factor [Kocuria sp. cx-455]